MEIGKEILNDLRETNDSLLTTKTNAAMRRLTAMTFTLLPITLITGIFGMNTANDALIIKNSHELLLVLILMVLIGLIMLVYFRGKKWL
jgi:magnesium transporter